MNIGYWLKQEPQKPLYPDVEWEKPEQRALRGNLLILGGSSHGFAAVAQAHADAYKAGAGELRVVLPDALKKTIDGAGYDCVFVPTNPSGGITRDALPQLQAAAAWATGLLLIGDAGRNSETAIVYEQLLGTSPDKPTIITRDAIDLLKSSWPELLQRDKTVFIATFAQLQKIFQSVYYPKTILFSMQLVTFVEALHKFTITYPATIVVFHQDQLLVAQGGTVTSTPWDEPMRIWRGSVAATAAVYAIQHPKLLPAVTASLMK